LLWRKNRVLEVAAEELAVVAERAGLSVRDIISLLDSGISLEQLVEYVAAKLSDKSVEN
jgi:hypothetical protein